MKEAIIERRKQGARLEELVEEFGRSRSYIANIVRGITIRNYGETPTRVPYQALYERRCKQWDAGKAIV